jgi:hypothetical protein
MFGPLAPGILYRLPPSPPPLSSARKMLTSCHETQIYNTVLTNPITHAYPEPDESILQISAVFQVPSTTAQVY